ncbi:MAG TPA: SRPBCC domain-containing protein [Steroidobacteraceae bacterium]|nr:SRPBCC domain-containing protein [Steroidobacteraceae bacterium]
MTRLHRIASALVGAGALLIMGARPAFAADHAVTSEAIINAPVAEVWKLFTTSAGLESWLGAHVEVDLKVGGSMRMQTDQKGQAGEDNTVVNQILSFEPERMLSLKMSRPPANFPYPTALQSVWSVIYFQPLEPGMTNVRIVSMGYTDDAESQQLMEYARKRNADRLEQLQKKFKPLCARCEKERAAGN